MGRLLMGLALLASACGARLTDPSEEPLDANAIGGGGDDSGNVAPADAFMLGPWGTPALIPGASTTTADEDDGTLSNSGLELVFALTVTADANRKDLYIATRTTTSMPFGTPTKLPFSATGSSEETPRFSPDDNTLYFASDRAGGAGGLDIYKATRTMAGGAWSAPAAVVGPNTAANEKWFMPCGTTTSYIVIAGPDLAAGTVGGPAPTVIAELNSTSTETGTFLTSDCLTIDFASARTGTSLMYTSHRTSMTTAWQTPTQVIDFAALGGAQEDPWIAADGRTFVFASNKAGTKDVYIATR